MLGGLQGMVEDERVRRRMLGLGAGALLLLVLLWPAIWTRLPHFFPDTGGYLFVAWGNLWLIDRSSFYGLSLRPLMAWNGISGLWLGLLPQLAAITLVLIATAKRLGATHWQWGLPAILLVTTGPFHASQLMPDAYAVVVLLLGWLCASRDPQAPGSPLLWLAAVAVCLPHSTYPAILIASAVATLFVLGLGGLHYRDIGTRIIALVIAVSAIAATQMLTNSTFFHRAVYSPHGPAFLYASLNEDGLIKPWLAENCPRDPRIRDLCRIAPQFPDDSQLLLWSPTSIFWKTVWKQRDYRAGIDWDSQLAIAARGALLASPTGFARAAAEATTEQFFSFGVLDDECPQTCLKDASAIQGALRRFRPELRDRVNASPQIQGTIRNYPLRAVTGLASFAGLAGLVVLLPLSLRRRDTVAASLLLAILAALLANAFVTGTLSDVHDRYQSRVIWLAPVACLLVVLRWRAARVSRPEPTPR